jgi:hypothetical protein
MTMLSADEAWELPGDPLKPMITVVAKAVDAEVAPPSSPAQESAIVQGIELERKSPYSTFGIQNWKVSAHRVVRLSPREFYLEMTGSYLPRRNVPVGFVERVYFTGETAYSVTFTRDLENESKWDGRGVSEILDGFLAEGPGTGHSSL